mgnify:CR=1 FL=1
MTQEALVPVEEILPSLLAGTPQNKVEQATAIADALSPIIEQRHLYIKIGRGRHVLFEGWTTLGALLGVFPVTAWTRQTEDGWEARVEARTLAGALVGAAEAMCSRTESSWANRDEYALRSMAQTRAGGKALRMPLGFIMQLAGFDATPAEEVDGGAGPVASPVRIGIGTITSGVGGWPASIGMPALISLVKDWVHDFGGMAEVGKALASGKLLVPIARALAYTADGTLTWLVGPLPDTAKEELRLALRGEWKAPATGSAAEDVPFETEEEVPFT